MKKLKLLLPIVLAFVMIFTIPFATACKDDPKPEIVTRTLQSIQVDASNAKKEYFLGEDFDKSGLIVKARLLRADNNEIEEVTLEDGDYTVDDKNYKKDKEGVYTISVSYSLSGVVKSDTYDVEVLIIKEGLLLKYNDNESLTLNLSSTSPTASIDLANLKVYEVDFHGLVTDKVLSSSDYSTEVYQGSKKVDDITKLTEGIYQIWASKKAVSDNEYTLRSFLNVYVVDSLEKIEFVDGDTTQTVGAVDKMTSTWLYKASFVSGATKNLTSKDVTVTDVVTTAETEEGLATVTYKYYNVKGEEQVKVCNVSYVITAEVSGGDSKSFLVEKDVVGTIAANGVITTNDLFEAVTKIEMTYSVGKDVTAGVPNPSKAVKAILQDGTEKTFENGLKQSGDGSSVAPEATTSDIEITAKSDITIRIYVGMANDSFNSDRAGVINYKVNDGTVETASVAKREKIVTLVVELKAGDKLTINGTIGANADATKTGKLWLFGIEATNGGGSSSASEAESFLVEKIAEGTIAANGVITTNDLFEAVTKIEMTYSVGKDVTAGVPNPSKAVKAILQDGTEKTFENGLKQSGDGSSVAPEATTSDIEITAKSDITIRIYVGMANDSFNSDRAGVINYKVNDGTVETASVAKREEIVTLVVELKAGDKLTINGTIGANADATKTGKLWLFGIEAKGI